ncbi:MAG: hypothetical protein D6706_10650 [Chloroflexi bacterium]|nr:MAG: hypothetical protein D6706_10650 [Chloroflexota bacterium]
MNRKRVTVIFSGLLVLVTAVSFLVWQGRVAAQTAVPQAPPSIYQTTLSSTNFTLEWNVMATGGGTISSTNFQINSTIGQPTVGTAVSTNYEVRSGFWQNFLDKLDNLFLPLIRRQ